MGVVSRIIALRTPGVPFKSFSKVLAASFEDLRGCGSWSWLSSQYRCLQIRSQKPSGTHSIKSGTTSYMQQSGVALWFCRLTNSRVYQLSSKGLHWGWIFVLDSDRSINENGWWPCGRTVGYSSLVRMTNAPIPGKLPSISSQQWIQVDHIIISYKWCCCLHDCRLR